MMPLNQEMTLYWSWSSKRVLLFPLLSLPLLLELSISFLVSLEIRNRASYRWIQRLKDVLRNKKEKKKKKRNLSEKFFHSAIYAFFFSDMPHSWCCKATAPLKIEL